jgi:hypothetical protein
LQTFSLVATWRRVKSTVPCVVPDWFVVMFLFFIISPLFSPVHDWLYKGRRGIMFQKCPTSISGSGDNARGHS